MSVPKVRVLRWLWQLLPLLGPLGCCPEEPLQFALEVIVKDSRTNSAPNAAVTMIVRDGSFADSITLEPPWPSDVALLPAGLGRAGTYSVEVRAPGFATWRQPSIEVGTGRCGNVRTRKALANLLPASGS
ncbi:MAG: hypothetical protein ILNGONEN_01939 [Syntrophorhabdaceae bacterium]|nr:hypothetical protein [Syntrophorhabdaceae bacterium]